MYHTGIYTDCRKKAFQSLKCKQSTGCKKTFYDKRCKLALNIRIKSYSAETINPHKRNILLQAFN